MNILFTSFAYYHQTSGVPIVVQYLAEGLVQRGHKVCVATRKNGQDLPETDLVNGVEVRRFDIGQTIFKKNVGSIEEYIRFVVGYVKDILVLECFQCQTTDILLPHLSEMKCKVIIHSHGGPGIHQRFIKWETDLKHSIGNSHNWMRWKKYYRKTIPRYSKFIDSVVCLSLCASDISYMTARMKSVEIVENAAQPFFFDESQYCKDVSKILQIKHKNYILCIANYIPNKGQKDIIKAFSRINTKDLSLVLIGSIENTYYKELCTYANIINQTTGKEIKLLTNIDRNLFPAIIHNSLLFIMASEHEEYPVSLVEAMAVGTPFVSTNAGCARLLPGGVTVLSKKDLSFVIQMLITHPEMLQKYGDQGRVYALNNNTTDIAIARFESVLNNTLNNESSLV